MEIEYPSGNLFGFNEVYLVDLTGQGKYEAFKEDLSIRSVAEDLNALVQY